MTSNVTTLGNDPIDKWACTRGDSRDLIQTWTEDKLYSGHTYQYVSNTGELDSIDTDNTDFVLGRYALKFLLYGSIGQKFLLRTSTNS